MEFNLDKAYNYYVDLKNISEAARQHCVDLGIPYSEKYRHRLSRAILKGEFEEGVDTYPREEKKAEVKQQEESSFNMPSAWDAENNKFLSLEEYC